MIHIFKYNDVLDNKNLDKLTENYEAYEQEIAELKKQISVKNTNYRYKHLDHVVIVAELKKQIAELQLKLFITNPLTKNKGAK